MGSQLFVDVQIPLLWGTRAILQDPEGRLSIVNLATEGATLEVLEDEPAQGVSYAPSVEGFVIMDANGVELYKVNPTAKSISALSLGLPPVTISRDSIRVGTNRFQNNMVSGSGVGILVTESGISLGGPIPSGITDLRSAPPLRSDEEGTWPRDRYVGPGGGLYTGVGGGMYTGPGGGAYTGPGGGLYAGPGGGLYTGPGGGLYAGPGGGLYTGPGGGLYTGPGGGLYTGPGGGLYTGPGGGLWTGPGEHYRSNWPPRDALLKALRERGLNNIVQLMLGSGF